MAERHDKLMLESAVLTDHALLQIGRRQVSPDDVKAVLADPEAVLHVRPGRVVAQRIVAGAPGRRYLLRVFVDVDRKPPEVVTVYRTSKIEKYRSRT